MMNGGQSTVLFLREKIAALRLQEERLKKERIILEHALEAVYQPRSRRGSPSPHGQGESDSGLALPPGSPS